jgi:methionyl-tRNA formyltransferase
MGTPEFAVEPLRAIIAAGYTILAVITAPDKPAGRGQKILFSPVKTFAIQNNIKVLQPSNLKAQDFIEDLKRLNANLQVVVAFRMLPELVWQMPEFGTLNLHASLLPQYRGAAPINHVIINGETETGVTTFFIEKDIDTGNIILSRKLPILPSDDAGTLHDRLMYSGGEIVLETLRLIETGDVKSQCQNNYLSDKTILNPAPKIFKKDCKIDWANSCIQIYNLVRGLSPAPGAFSNLNTESDGIKQIKIFKTSFQLLETDESPGTIITDNKNSFSVIAGNGLVHIEELQIEGKKKMSTSEFLRGNNITGHFSFIE